MGAQSASLTSPSPPTGRPQRAQPPTCQGNERSARAARKRRSKLCSRREVSSLSSGAMAGRSAALLGRLGGSEADPKGVEPRAARGTRGGVWGGTGRCSAPDGWGYQGGARRSSDPGVWCRGGSLGFAGLWGARFGEGSRRVLEEGSEGGL